MATQRRGRSNNGEKPNVNSNSSSASQDLEEPLATAACENCRTRKVRCDKKIPQCSNCEKAGVPCEFPNREKRVNHVNQLIEDVSSLASRLDSIDATLSTLVQHMSSSQPASLPTTNTSLVPEISACVDTEDIDSIFYSGHFTGGSGNNFVVAVPPYSGLGQDGSLSHIGARSLFENSRRMLVGLLEQLKCSSSRDLDSLSKPKGEDNGVFTPTKSCLIESELSAKYNQYPFVQYLDRLSVTSDGQSVALPPQSLLEMCLPVFFKYFNVTMPIFNESRLREAINSCYVNKVFRADEAYHLCFNNIIVLALGLQSRAARIDQTFLKGMSDELLPAFLNNSFRAFHHLSAFLQPRLICCQALATLAMVAREYHESRVFDTICHLTSLAVKSIGLQQCNTVSNNSLSDTDKERQNLYWAVFIMDKQRTYISGRPFDLHLYDSDVQLFQTIATPALVQQCWKAHIYMMAIWEEIYIYLYSLRALRKGPAYRQNQISRLSTLSRRWYAGNTALLCNKPSPSEISPDEGWQIELKYAFHLGQVLIHDFSSEESSQQVALTNARAALRIIQSVFQTKLNKASISLLMRLFRHYPLVSIHRLFSSFLANPTADLLEDLDLINIVAEALDTICDPNIPTSCLRTVNEGIQWYRAVAMVFRTYYKGLKSQPPKRPYELFPAISGDQGRDEPPENLLQKRRKTHPQSEEDSNHLPRLDPSAHSWALLDVEVPVEFDNLPSEWMTSNGPLVSRLQPTKEGSDCSSKRSSCGLQPALQPEDEISRFLNDTLPPPSTVSSSCMPEPQRPFTAMGCGGITVPTDLMPTALDLFPYNSQVAEDGQDGDLFQLCAGQSDLGDPWADIGDYIVPDEFFLHA